MGMSTYQELTDRALEYINSGNWEDAYEMLKQKEAENDKSAIAVLANFYLYGVGVAKDTENAISYFEKAIEMGSGDAAWELGRLYFNNDEGIPISHSRAVSYFEKGAELGNEDCYGALAECYINGRGVVENYPKGFEYAQRAAKAGNPTGMINLAICYDDGLGTSKDPYAASHWYKEFLEYEPEDDFVMLRIALCLADPYERFGIRATGEMLQEAFYYASKAVEKGNVEAHLIVGWFYEKGEIVSRDYDIAHKYMQLAADNGNEVAMEHLKIYRKSIYGTYYIP